LKSDGKVMASLKSGKTLASTLENYGFNWRNTLLRSKENSILLKKENAFDYH
jgi:hypothetical protein